MVDWPGIIQRSKDNTDFAPTSNVGRVGGGASSVRWMRAFLNDGGGPAAEEVSAHIHIFYEFRP
jgi:hypothetical protein